MEIERKYLVDNLPEGYEAAPRQEIEQCYLSTSPTLRIRRMGDVYILTIKVHQPVATSTAIHNIEEEFALSAEQYQRLKTSMIGSAVEKTRYRIVLGREQRAEETPRLVAELDIFHGRHEGLVLVEVEFADTEEANHFVPPEWFGREVSDDPHYRNSYLALHGGV